jgi:hypothetical protein
VLEGRDEKRENREEKLTVHAQPPAQMQVPLVLKVTFLVSTTV